MSSQATIWEQLLSYWFPPLPLPQPFPIQNDPTTCSSQGHRECHLAVFGLVSGKGLLTRFGRLWDSVHEDLPLIHR